MKKVKKKNSLEPSLVIGIIFLVWGISAILNSLYIKNPTQVLWLCYWSLILMGLGMILKNTTLILSQIYMLALPILIWNLDFFHWLLLQQPLWGITDYYFLEKTFSLGKIISLQHLFALPVGIYIARIIGVKKHDAWKWSFLQIVLVYLIVVLFTSPEANINCVFRPCGDLVIEKGYQLLWLLSFFAATFVSYLAIDRAFFRKQKK